MDSERNPAEASGDDDPTLSAYTLSETLPEGPARVPLNVRPSVPGYEILSPLGSGAMGTVWRARQVTTKQIVALKVLAIGPDGGGKLRARFEREIELAARLKHPNIARVYDGGVTGDCYYLAMELVEGEHLDAYLARRRREDDLTDAQYAALALMLMEEVCGGVEHAHQGQVIHRDLKPSNILVRKDGTAVIVDFGVAKAIAETDTASAGSERQDLPRATLHDRSPALDLRSTRHQNAEPPSRLEDDDVSEATEDPMLSQATVLATGQGVLIGTLAYMSPEQAQGATTELSTQSDVYSLGVILYKLLTGRYPHNLSGAGGATIRHRKIHENILAPGKANPNLPPPLQALLSKALAADRRVRYASVSEMRRDIACYCEDRPMIAYEETTGRSVLRKLSAYNIPAAIALSLVCTMGLVVLYHAFARPTINVVSVYDLLGFALLSGIAFVFLMAYLTCGFRRIDLIFGVLISCSAAVCCLTFLIDNILLIGERATAHPGAAKISLMLGRIQWAMAIVALALEIHFILIYCGLEKQLKNIVHLAYAVMVVSLPGVLSSWFLQAPVTPSGPVVSVANIAPWMALPQAGATVLLVAWLVVNAAMLLLIYRSRKKRPTQSKVGPYKCLHLVQLAILVQVVGVLADIAQTFFAVTTLSAYVVCAVISGILLAAALMRERVQSDRKELYEVVKSIKAAPVAP